MFIIAKTFDIAAATSKCLLRQQLSPLQTQLFNRIWRQINIRSKVKKEEEEEEEKKRREATTPATSENDNQTLDSNLHRASQLVSDRKQLDRQYRLKRELKVE